MPGPDVGYQARLVVRPPQRRPWNPPCQDRYCHCPHCHRHYLEYSYHHRRHCHHFPLPHHHFHALNCQEEPQHRACHCRQPYYCLPCSLEYHAHPARCRRQLYCRRHHRPSLKLRLTLHVIHGWRQAVSRHDGANGGGWWRPPRLRPPACMGLPAVIRQQILLAYPCQSRHRDVVWVAVV